MNVISNHPPTEELQAPDAAHHLHPFTDGEELVRTGVTVITRASGVMLTDSDGNGLLDAMAGLWCVNIGYGRDELAEAARTQMRQLPYYNTFFHTTHPPAIALSHKLSELTGGTMTHAFFAGSGSEANDTNIRIVRHYWRSLGKSDKTVVISRKNSYHGSTLGSGSLSGMANMLGTHGLPVPDITHIGQPYWYAEGTGWEPDDFGIARAKELEQEISRIGEDRVAAFIAEPIQGAGGVIIPPETYWPEIQRICDKHEILLIADEVICGFGRTGNWFGKDTFRIRPDLMTIAKGLSSGYVPIAASLMTDNVAEVINESGEFAHGFTYSGHPVACAVALENIRILEDEQIVDYAANVASPFLAGRAIL